MENNCLVTKLKGTVDNSNLNFSYLDGIIVDFSAGSVEGVTKVLRILESLTHVKIHVLTGKLYFDSEKTNEVPQDYETISNMFNIFYPVTEQTTVVLYNKFEGMERLDVVCGRVKFADFNAIRTINNITIIPGPMGAFVEGARELIDYVKITYKNKTKYKPTAYPSATYSSGLLFNCKSSQLRINGKVSNPLSLNNFLIVPTTTEISSGVLKVIEGPVEVYVNNQDRTHVLTYDPSTDSVTYYGQWA